MTKAKKETKVKCVRCKKIFTYQLSEFRPFCSERCKQADLGMWLMESYKIPTNEYAHIPDVGEYDEE